MTNSLQPAAIPAKTLYLDGRGRLRVWREGPALCVFARDKALQRVPLQRISRIVVSGQVEWATPALIACAEAGIGVVFLRGNGAVKARLHGPCAVHDYTGLAEILDQVLENPQGSYWVRQWLGACAQQARRQLCMTARAVPRSARAESVHAYVSRRALLHVRHGDLRRFDRRLKAALSAHVGLLLRDTGIEADNPALVAGSIDLEAGFTEILIWNLQLAKISALKKLATRARRQAIAYPRLNFATAAGFYESQAPRVAEDFRQLQIRLHKTLLEVSRDHAG